MGKNKTISKVIKSPEVEKFDEEFVKPALDQFNGFPKDFFKQLIGSAMGENSAVGQKAGGNEIFVKDPVSHGEINIFQAADHQNKADTKKQSEKPLKPEMQKEAAINYSRDLLNHSERSSDREKEEMRRRLEEILTELKRLISSSKVLRAEFAAVSMTQTPTQAGEYHLNFFDWLLLTIRAARQKVEDSGAWLKAVKGKNSKAHWNKISKKGADTSVTLSNERSIATQVG